MLNVRPGDILIYAVAAREKGTIVHYYGCEAIGSISGDLAFNHSGEPITGVVAIYRRKNTAPAVEPGCTLLARPEDDPDVNPRLSRRLEELYGPGELITGFSCQCEAACGMLKKRLRAQTYSE